MAYLIIYLKKQQQIFEPRIELETLEFLSLLSYSHSPSHSEYCIIIRAYILSIIIGRLYSIRMFVRIKKTFFFNIF